MKRAVLTALLTLAVALPVASGTAAQAGTSGQWVTRASMPTARAESAFGVINGQLYVAGGEDGTQALAALEVYDPSTDTWTAKTPMPVALNAAASAVINGRLYVAGGTRFNDPVQFGPFNTLYSYDPTTDTWTTLAPMPTPEADTVAANVNGELYVVGGVSQFVTNNPRNAVLQVYDPSTNTWTTKASMPTARALAEAAAINGQLYVVGGTANNTNSGYTGALEVYDPATDTWSSRASMPTPRQVFAADAVNGQLFAIGGDPGGGVPQTAANEVYDPGTDTWAAAAPMPTARYGMASGVIGTTIFVVGGATGFGNGVPQTANEAFSSGTAAPAVTAVSPASGPLAGGTSVTITGSGFTGATAVNFGSTPASSFTVTSDSQITATSPAATGFGPVDVTVTTPGGTSTTSGADQYSYIYAFTGYLSPVENPPTVNQVHAGQAIPMQFQLGGNQGLNIIAAGYPTATQISCSTGAPVNTGTLTDTAGGSGLQYDPSSGTYTYVWKTLKSWSGTCQQFDMKLADGTHHLADFQLK
jgi:N-acetylneuraminic acid mutarotase